MKKFILAALAASVVATPVLAAPYDGNNNGRYEQQRHDERGNGNDRSNNDRGRYEQRGDSRQQNRWDRNDNRGPQRIEYRRWQKGQRFDNRYAYNYRVLSPRAYHLREAPRGYRWVQSGNDAVMVGITTGLIAAVIAGALN